MYIQWHQEEIVELEQDVFGHSLAKICEEFLGELYDCRFGVLVIITIYGHVVFRIPMEASLIMRKKRKEVKKRLLSKIPIDSTGAEELVHAFLFAKLGSLIHKFVV
jgi:hypothetical protein